MPAVSRELIERAEALLETNPVIQEQIAAIARILRRYDAGYFYDPTEAHQLHAQLRTAYYPVITEIARCQPNTDPVCGYISAWDRCGEEDVIEQLRIDKLGLYYTVLHQAGIVQTVADFIK